MGMRARHGLLALMAAFVATASPRALLADVAAEDVLRAIERGRDYLLRSQRSDGSWIDLRRQPIWSTARAVRTLLATDVSHDHPAVRKAIDYLRQARSEQTTIVAEQTMAFLAVSPAEDRLHIRAKVEWLQRTQIKNGPSSGLWAEGVETAGGVGDVALSTLLFMQQRAVAGDKVVTQWPIWALRHAAEIGIDVDPEVFRRTQTHWRSDQRPDGGWGYPDADSTPAMTAIGIASLMMIGSQLHSGKERIDPDGHIHACGQYEQDETLEKALRWMTQNFSADPARPDYFFVVYYLSHSERAWAVPQGPLGRRFGQHDWYREGAEFLVRRQDPLTGSWNDPTIGLPPLDATIYALWLLAEGKTPVVINKLAHGNGDDWNHDRDDVRHVTAFLSKHWDRPLSWQTVELAAATAEDLLQTPIAYLNGHEAPQLSDADVQKLRDYVAEGGTILAEACCGREEFDKGFRELVKRIYPEAEYELKPLSPEHPLWRAEFVLDPAGSPLWGVDFGCRTAVIYSPHDLSCFWEQGQALAREDGPPPAADTLLHARIERAFQLAANLVAYATGQELPDKLTRRQAFTTKPLPPPAATRGGLQIAGLRHSGGQDAAPRALDNLARALRELVPAMQVDTNPPDVFPLDPELFHYPLAYMHGRRSFRFSDEELNQLRRYLERGGVLLADATCGAEAFDRSFRQFCRDLLPDLELQRIPPDHPLFKSADDGGVWFDLSRVTRREPRRARPEAPLRSVSQAGEPFLEGLLKDDRYVILYSPYDISCALERSRSVECRGYVHEDALRIAVNAVLFAVHYQ